MDARFRELERRAQAEGLTPAVVAALHRYYERQGEVTEEPQIFVAILTRMSSTRPNARILDWELVTASEDFNECWLAAALSQHYRAVAFSYGTGPNRDFFRSMIDEGEAHMAIDYARANGMLPASEDLTILGVTHAAELIERYS